VSESRPLPSADTVNPAPVPATEQPAQAASQRARFLPMAVCVGIVALVSIGLIAWSHIGWHRLQVRAHDVDNLLHEAQQQARQSQWMVEQRVVGNSDPDGSASHLSGGARAAAAAQQLLSMGQPALEAPLHNLQGRLAKAATALELRWREPDAIGAMPIGSGGRLHPLR